MSSSAADTSASVASRVTLMRRIVPVIGFIGLALGLLFFTASLLRPSVGVGLQRSVEGWTVSFVDASGLGHVSGVTAGQKVTSINGVAATSGPESQMNSGEIRSFEVVTNEGLVTTVSVLGARVTLGQVGEASFYFIIGFLFWTMGALVYRLRPDLRPARILWLLGIFILVGLTSVSARERGYPGTIQLEFGSILLVGPLFADLFLSFPRDRSGNRLLTYLLYIPFVVLAVSFMIFGGGEANSDPWFRIAVLPVFTLGVLIGLGSLVWNSFSEGYVRMRQQARIVLAGALVGVVPFMALSVFPFMGWKQTVIQPQYSIVALVALPASIGYTLVRHRLFDIDLVVRRSLVYGLLSLVMACAYMAVIWRASILLDSLPGSLHVVTTVAVAAVGLITFAPVRNRFQAVVDRRFYKDRHDYRQVLRSTSSSLMTMKDPDEISHFISRSLSEVLGSSGVCLLTYASQGYFVARDSVGSYVDSPKHAELIRVVSALKEGGTFPNMAPKSSGAAFFVPLQVGGRRVGMICLGDKLSGEDFSLDDLSFLFTFATQAAAALENAHLFDEAREHRLELGRAYEQLQQSTTELARRKKELEDAYLAMARTLILTLESRDPYTRGHSDRVSRLVLRIAPILGITGEQLQKLELAARLHDIGKTGVADAVLLKPGSFDPMERAEIESHPARGVEILRFLDFLKDVLPYVESHHEWFDGTGYPRGLKGEEIPLGGRILSVADSYDAMVSKRAYRNALPHDEAIRRLLNGSGTQWDPKVVEAFVRSEGGTRV